MRVPKVFKKEEGKRECYTPGIFGAGIGTSRRNSTLAVLYPSLVERLSTLNLRPPTVSTTERPSGKY